MAVVQFRRFFVERTMEAQGTTTVTPLRSLAAVAMVIWSRWAQGSIA